MLETKERFGTVPAYRTASEQKIMAQGASEEEKTLACQYSAKATSRGVDQRPPLSTLCQDGQIH